MEGWSGGWCRQQSYFCLEAMKKITDFLQAATKLTTTRTITVFL